MPRVSEFYGIVIAMYRGDHAPPPFHVRYAEHRAVFQIDPIRMIRGCLPKRAHGLVTEWAARHQAALMDNWDRARRHEDPRRIPPLD